MTQLIFELLPVHICILSSLKCQLSFELHLWTNSTSTPLMSSVSQMTVPLLCTTADSVITSMTGSPTKDTWFQCKQNLISFYKLHFGVFVSFHVLVLNFFHNKRPGQVGRPLAINKTDLLLFEWLPSVRRWRVSYSREKNHFIFKKN